MSYQGGRMTALVTGASSGIGAAIARRLAAAGTDLVLVGRDPARLSGVPQAVEPELLAADLAEPAGMAAVAQRLRSADRPVGMLVHAAGLTTAQPFGDAPL